jgi:hypothetical protein
VSEKSSDGVESDLLATALQSAYDDLSEQVEKMMLETSPVFLSRPYKSPVMNSGSFTLFGRRFEMWRVNGRTLMLAMPPSLLDQIAQIGLCA